MLTNLQSEQMKAEEEKREIIRKQLELEQERADKNAEEVATLAL